MSSLQKLAVFGNTMPESCAQKLQALGFKTVILPPYEKLERRVSSHADLLLFPIKDRIFTHKEYIERLPRLKEELFLRGYSIYEIDEEVGASYPDDVLLNCLKVGNHIFSNTERTADKIHSYAKDNGYVPINVRQGYARCTACPISDNAIITADSSIASAAERIGIDVLRISCGAVRLDSYEYGFIGGACGVFENKIFFSGNLYSHPDGERIEEFCKKRKKEVISLSDEPLVDVGSIFLF